MHKSVADFDWLPARCAITSRLSIAKSVFIAEATQLSGLASAAFGHHAISAAKIEHEAVNWVILPKSPEASASIGCPTASPQYVSAE